MDNNTTANNDPVAAAQRVTLVGMGLDIILSLLKIVVGFTASSYALIADGIHSVSDVVTDLFVLVVTRIAGEAPDSDHPYGHARFETLGTVLLGGVLIGVAAILAYENITRLITDTPVTIPHWPALVVAVISIIGKEWIYRYTLKVGHAVRSNLLIANAWHSRSDALSSVVVFIGIAGTMAGVAWLDTAAAIVVAGFIAKIGWGLVWDSLVELVDTSIPEQELHELQQVARSVPGVLGMHAVRNRRLGQDIHLDLHIMVSPEASASEGHQIGKWVCQRLHDHSEHVKDITYHIDTEDDGLGDIEPDGTLLPLREDVLQQLSACWQTQQVIEQALRIDLHYIENKIWVELYLPTDLNLASDKLQAELVGLAAHLPWLGELTIWRPDNQG